MKQAVLSPLTIQPLALGRFLNRPKVLNAINGTLARERQYELNQLAAQPRLRCLVIKGEGKAFMAGGDVAAFLQAGDDVADMVRVLLRALNPVILTLRSTLYALRSTLYALRSSLFAMPRTGGVPWRCGGCGPEFAGCR